MILEGIQYVIGGMLMGATTILVGGLVSLMSWSMVLDERRGSPAYRPPAALIALTGAVLIDLVAWLPGLIADVMHVDLRYPVVFIVVGSLSGGFILVLTALGLGIRERKGGRSAVVVSTVIIAVVSIFGFVVMFCPSAFS